MTRSLLAAVRGAFAAGAADDSSIEENTEVEASASASPEDEPRERAEQENPAMADANAGAPAAANAGIPHAEHEAAVTAARAEGRAEGVSAERGRINQIMASEAGKANPSLAAHLAYETDTAPEAAEGMLKAAGAAKPEKPAASLASRQSGSDLPRADLPASADHGWGKTVEKINARKAG